MPPRPHQTRTLSGFITFFPCLLLLSQLAGQATCRPTRVLRSLYNGLDRPQNQIGFTRPETVHIEKNITLLGAVVTERCMLAFTPVVLRDGLPAVQVVKSCSFEAANDASNHSVGSCGSTTTTTVTITSVSTGVSATATATSTSTFSITANSSMVTYPSTLSSSSGVSNGTAPISTSSPTATASTNTTITVSANASITLSFTSLSAPSTTDASPETSTLSSISSAITSTSSNIAPSGSPTSSTPTVSSSLNPSLPPSPTQTPQSDLSSTITSTTTLSGMTSPANNVAVAPQQSSTLPKVIGAFAGVAVLLLIIGGSIGYLKLKKLNKKEEEEPIRWPVTN